MGERAALLGFDSLPHQAALLDADGIIIAVNAAWRAFADSNGASRELKEGIGLDYLSVCRHAVGSDAAEAPLAHASIEGGLNGNHPQSTFLYPCHSPAESRWFLCATSSYSFTTSSQRCVLVSHVRLIDSHLGSVRTAQLDAPGGDHPLALAHAGPGSPVCDLLQSQTLTGCWELAPDLGSMHWSMESYRIYGMSPDSGPATFKSMLSIYSSRDKRCLQSLFLQLAHFGVPFDVELRAVSRTKKSKRIRLTGRATIAGTKVGMLYGLIQDITADDVQTSAGRSELDG